jgi:hypothetical protein
MRVVFIEFRKKRPSADMSRGQRDGKYKGFGRVEFGRVGRSNLRMGWREKDESQVKLYHRFVCPPVNHSFKHKPSSWDKFDFDSEEIKCKKDFDSPLTGREGKVHSIMYAKWKKIKGYKETVIPQSQNTFFDLLWEGVELNCGLNISPKSCTTFPHGEFLLKY